MEPSIRNCTVLIVDIAGSVALREKVGELEASGRIRQLLEQLIGVAQANGGMFLKSYGDDVISTFEGEHDGAAAAAEAAIASQRCAQAAGLPLYAGLCSGPVEFIETMGRPDAYGQALNLAARLHKLTEDAPGRIFMPAELRYALPMDLQREASPFGMRMIKGYGPMEVWTLSWNEQSSTVTFVPSKSLSMDAGAPMRVGPLTIWHGGRGIELDPVGEAFVIGRAADCALHVPDPEPRISSRHLMVQIDSGMWMAHDISRNGCWVRDDRTGEEFPLLPGAKVRLPARGAICLGRAFNEDAAGAYTVYFESALRR